MKNLYNHLLMLIGGILISSSTFSQCLNTSSYGSGTASTTVGGTVTLSTCNWASEYATISNVISGNTYRVNASITNTWVTIRRGSYNGPVVLSAVQGTNWVAPASGTYYAHFNSNSSCATNAICRTTSVTTVAIPAPPPVVNPCNSISSLSCGVSSSYTLTGGNGAWNSLGGPFSTPGQEKVFSFTPTVTGIHTITVTNNEGWVDLFYKSGSCGSTGWTYINDNYAPTETQTVSLTAGTLYYFLLDDENITASNGSITFTCPVAAPDPCNNNIQNISTCGSLTNFNLIAATGLWNNYGGPYSTPGVEKIFRFTPTVSGTYLINVNHNNGSWVDLFYKIQNSQCNSTGWTYLDDINTSATNSVYLNAGSTYLFLLDDEDINASSGTISIECPCIAGLLDGSYNYNGNFSINGNTVGACNNSSFRPSEDLTYEITVPCNGNYIFSTCNNTTWDTYLYLSTSAGGGNILASNDDACGLQSSISANLSVGTYYLSVEGFSSTSAGNFTLNISGSGSTPTITGSVSHVTCYGGNNGIITASINESGISSALALNGLSGNGTWSGLSAGNYTLTASNCWGTSSQIFTVNQPDQLIADVTSGEIACYGGSTNLTVTATGGTAPFSGTGNFNVTAGAYDYTIVDANGCQASNSISISQPQLLVASSNATEILCFGGSSTITVEANGGTSPYSGNGDYTVNAGAYDYTITDANGCQASTSISVSQPQLLVASSSATEILCFGGSSTVTVAANGGTTPYSGNGDYTVNAGTYDYTITDANGCQASTSISISQPQLLVASSSASEILCFGGSSTITVEANGGTSPYSGNGDYTVTAGAYDYTITDANGCQASTSISISQPELLTVDAGDAGTLYYGYQPLACQTLNAISNGGTGIVSYNWNNGSTNANTTVCPSSSSTYTITVTDENGCIASDEVYICVIDVICFAGNSSNQKVEICHNGNTICINASAVAAHLAHGCTLGNCSEVNQCDSRSQLSNSTQVSMDSFTLYPNPTQGSFIVTIYTENTNIIPAKIFNSIGQEILNIELHDGDNLIDISSQPNGVYFIQSSSQHTKFIKQ